VTSVVEQFDLKSYVPQGIQDDYATGASYYAQFQQATQGISVGPHGTIQVSDAAASNLLYTMAAAASAAVPVAAPFISAFLALYAALPHAGAGPGVCSTSPPPGPSPAQLTSWSHFWPWSSTYGGYTPGAANSFEAFANPILEYNWLLGANCYSEQMVAPPILLATLVAAWNSRHSASSKRTISRSFQHINSFGGNSGYDPIADALMTAIVVNNTHLPANPSFAEATNPNAYTGPDQATSTFQVNDGPIILKPITLHLPQPTVATAAAPTAVKTVAGVTAAATGTAVVAAIIWSFATGKAWDWALGQAWREVKDMVSAKESRGARETRSRRRRRS
jgi:hypothetical protein